jgi:hypothetical protein
VIDRVNAKNHSTKISTVVFNQAEPYSYPEPERSDSALRKAFGGSSEQLNKRVINERYMNKSNSEI